MNVLVFSISLIIVFTLFMAYRWHKKEKFNSINIGNEICYYQETFCDEYSDVLESDIVTSVEYFENGEDVKLIHTKKGKTYNFLDYIRDDFLL